MRWRPKEKHDNQRKWKFLILPLVLDDGLRVMWEWVSYNTTITKEWAGMGADGCEGITEYWSRAGLYLGKVRFKS